MSHEPTDLEREAAKVAAFKSDEYPITAALTAANRIRDRRIRDAALYEAIEICERFRRPDGSASGLAYSLAAAIRALKDKTDDPAPE